MPRIYRSFWDYGVATDEEISDHDETTAADTRPPLEESGEDSGFAFPLRPPTPAQLQQAPFPVPPSEESEASGEAFNLDRVRRRYYARHSHADPARDRSARSNAPRGQWPTPATRSDRRQGRLDRAEEKVRTHSGMVTERRMAYPYARRHSHWVPEVDGRVFFGWLGLRETFMHRVYPDGHEEFSLAPPVIALLDLADWRLNAMFNSSLQTPISPQVADPDEVNSVVHDFTDHRLSIAPMYAPDVPRAGRMRREDWVSVQRGLLQEMEEIARLAIHNQSTLILALQRARQPGQSASDAAALVNVVESLLHTQTSALITSLHQVVYAQRHAHVRGAGAQRRAAVLRQPVFGQRRLFNNKPMTYAR